MPLLIVKQDITQVVCDAIVNPTDQYFSGSGGTDRAVHQAAGIRLEQECRRLGELGRGQVAVTGAYELPCRYVFHTRGPAWQGGGCDEETLLRSCYVNALIRAAEMGLNSIAFPLISSGTFGFPKDKVLSIALTAIGSFLSLAEPDLEVRLCVYDPEAYEITLSLELDRFLRRENAVPAAPPCAMISEAPKSEPRQRRFFASRRSAASREEMPDRMPCREETLSELSCAASEASIDDLSAGLDAWLKQQDESFADMLTMLINKKDITEVECYKRANVSRKTFYKIYNTAGYKPSKPTVIAFSIALKLTLQETQTLLRTVGFTLSRSNTFDRIIEFYITRGVYDIYEINAALYKYDQVCLGC